MLAKQPYVLRIVEINRHLAVEMFDPMLPVEKLTQRAAARVLEITMQVIRSPLAGGSRRTRAPGAGPGPLTRASIGGEHQDTRHDGDVMPPRGSKALASQAARISVSGSRHALPSAPSGSQGVPRRKNRGEQRHRDAAAGQRRHPAVDTHRNIRETGLVL
jgi:hypothetical protein